MNCEKCGAKTVVIDTRTSADLDGDARVAVVLMALGKDVEEHTNNATIGRRGVAKLASKAGLRLRRRRCRACGHEQATVEMTAGTWEGRR